MDKDIREAIEKMTCGIKREGFKELYDYMVDNGFYETPASGGNHSSKIGGLAEHTYFVMVYADLIAEALLIDVNYEALHESIVLSALLHDLGKLGDYNKKMYIENVLKSGSQSDAKPFKRNPDLLAIDHATRSLCIINRFMDLTEDEEFAIRYHDGLYEPSNYGVKGNETELYIIIHTADLWASHIVEK